MDYLLRGNWVLIIDGEKGVKVGVKNMEFVEIFLGIDLIIVILKLDL